MNIRNCAKNCKAFCRLFEVYDNREQELVKWKNAGKKVIGELGADVPDELILAAGMYPIRIYANPLKNMKDADKYLEYAFDPMLRAQFQKMVDGTYNNLLDGIAISNSSDVYTRIYLYIRELKRIEPERNIPDIAYIDWMFTRNRMHQERNETVIKLFKKQIEIWAERKITDEQIEKAAQICNENKAALRKIRELRCGKEIHISGSEMLVIIGSVFFMEREEHTRLVNEIFEDAKNWPILDGIRLFYTGSVQMDTSLYEDIEKEGYVIVGEDHDWGNRFYNRDYSFNKNTIRALVDCYMLREFSSKKAFVDQRVEALNRMVKESAANSVIFYTNIFEEAASWEYPSQKKNLEGHHIKTMHFAKMHWPLKESEYIDLHRELQKFATMYKEE